MCEEIDLGRRRFVGKTILTAASLQFNWRRSAQAQIGEIRQLPSLSGATEWLNSAPLSPAGLKGKVVLVDFWTYSCINWRRTLPYLSAWARKYKDQGLVIIGVHTPEFVFEKNMENVRWAVRNMQVEYPVAVDNNRAIWLAFKNQYWPALYFVDSQGRIRHHVFGEGEYDKSELMIQELLIKAGAHGVQHDLISVDPRGLEVDADWADLQSPETYAGYEHSTNFSSPGGTVRNKSHIYTASEKLKLNHWALSGDWTIRGESARSNQANGRVAFCFHARDLHLVMGPAALGTPVRFRVKIDGEAPGVAHGSDINERGDGTLREQRLYQLVRQSKPILDRRFEIEFLDPGVEIFSFTFG
jgi:thiol-disulfide isomerase/thioredoxin